MLLRFSPGTICSQTSTAKAVPSRVNEGFWVESLSPLQPEEDFALIEKANDEQGQRNRHHRDEQCPETVGGMIESGLDVTAHQASGQGFEIDDLVQNVNGEGIGADPDEGGGPSLVFLDVD